MDISIFPIFEKIDVIPEILETQEQIIYSSFIESIGQHSMFIAPPLLDDVKIQSRIGDIITIRFTMEDCSYFFSTTFLNYHWNEMSLWEVSLPIHIQRVQLRDYVRVKINLELELEFLNEQCQRTAITTLTKDFSAGGVQVVMPVAPPADSKVMVILPLPDHTTLRIKGEFVRIKYPKTAAQKHFASIKFCEVDAKITRKIVKYLFDKQIERRQKEKTLDKG